MRQIKSVFEIISPKDFFGNYVIYAKGKVLYAIRQLNFTYRNRAVSAFLRKQFVACYLFCRNIFLLAANVKI